MGRIPSRYVNRTERLYQRLSGVRQATPVQRGPVRYKEKSVRVIVGNAVLALTLLRGDRFQALRDKYEQVMGVSTLRCLCGCFKHK